MRQLTIPEPISYAFVNGDKVGPWGLVEIILQRVLPDPECLFSTESANAVISLTHKFRGMAGKDKTGQRVLLTDTEHEFLKVRFGVAIRKLADASEEKVLPLHLALDVAIYARALFSAESCPDEKPQVSEEGVPPGARGT